MVRSTGFGCHLLRPARVSCAHPTPPSMPVRHYPTLSAYIEANRRTTPEYDDVALELVEGALPPDLLGTLLRNGNGHFEQHGVKYDHLV